MTIIVSDECPKLTECVHCGKTTLDDTIQRAASGLVVVQRCFSCGKFQNDLPSRWGAPPPEWVEKYIKPLEVCDRAIKEACKYCSPQEAWDNWADSNDMLDFLKQVCVLTREKDLALKIILCEDEVFATLSYYQTRVVRRHFPSPPLDYLRYL